MLSRKTTILSLFAILVAIQLFVPLFTIFKQEGIINNGGSYKFRTRPVDPYDPFMGRYIVLNFDIDTYNLTKQERNIVQNSYVNVFLDADNDGFAYIKSLGDVNDMQNEGVDYLRAEVLSANGYEVRLKFPFDRYYMSDEAAQLADKVYNRIIRNSEHKVYAIVKVKNGEGLVETVYVDDMTLEDFLRDFEE